MMIITMKMVKHIHTHILIIAEQMDKTCQHRLVWWNETRWKRYDENRSIGEKSIALQHEISLVIWGFNQMLHIVETTIVVNLCEFELILKSICHFESSVAGLFTFQYKPFPTRSNESALWWYNIKHDSRTSVIIIRLCHCYWKRNVKPYKVVLAIWYGLCMWCICDEVVMFYFLLCTLLSLPFDGRGEKKVVRCICPFL